MDRGTKAVIASLYFLGLVACETQEDNSIEEARQCLDNASVLSQTDPVDAATMATYSCQPMIANINSTDAGLIGVGIVLVMEQKISQLSQVENAISNGNNAMATSLSFLVFQDQADVTNMTIYAQMSQDEGSQELASVISLAYYANIAAGELGGALNSSATPAQVSADVTQLANDPVNGPAAAQALVSAQQSACAGSGASTSLCNQLTTAVGTNTSNYQTILNNAAACISAGSC
jgi:hypothetical protein